jgi:hypothetical protein
LLLAHKNLKPFTGFLGDAVGPQLGRQLGGGGIPGVDQYAKAKGAALLRRPES